jgi:hypothetical protein
LVQERDLAHLHVEGKGIDRLRSFADVERMVVEVADEDFDHVSREIGDVHYAFAFAL